MDNHNEKNFRSSYYTKVGFRKVEERKSIEAFLSPKVDIAKIKLFLKSYALPELHRLRVWRILLGIHEPETEENQELKRINCEQLNRSVSILAPEELLVSESQRIALMVILARGDSKQPLIEQFQSDQAKNVLKLATCLTSICSLSFEDNFYMVSSFAKLIEEQRPHFAAIKEEAFVLIQKDDPDLYRHLNHFEMDHPVHNLLSRCYAEVFDISLTIKVWDKVLGGYFRQIMPKLTAAFLVAIKPNLIHTVEQEQLESILFQPLSSDKNDLIIDYI